LCLQEELRHNLWNGMCYTCNNSLIISWIPDFIMDQCGWKLELYTNFKGKYPRLILNICKTVYYVKENVHLWPYVSQASLCMSRNWYYLLTYRGKAQCEITKTMCELFHWVHEKVCVWLHVNWTVLQINMAEN